MKSLLWFVLGLVGGFVAAHLVNKDPRGHEALVEVDARITEFTDRIGEAYRAQEAKIDGIAAEVKDAAANALGAAKDAAADAIDAAGDAASTAASAAKKTAAQLTD
ncbi:ATPase [Microbacterium sp. F2E]|uniref:ATPase n=1 Tax=Microbacterium TaxID=33882 RepID=UPI001E52FDAF|nr:MULTISPECIES: ATPase [Microbacterium]MCC9054996.1 ATPase [Microbacterium sp. F2E]